MTWPEVADLVEEIWKDERSERTLVNALLDAVTHMTDETPAAHRSRVTDMLPVDIAMLDSQKADAGAMAMELAELTANDGEQRALDYSAPDLEELQDLRLEIRDQICSAPEGAIVRHVRPWLWRIESTGRAMTVSGRELGYELRLSRYVEPVCPGDASQGQEATGSKMEKADKEL